MTGTDERSSTVDQRQIFVFRILSSRLVENRLGLQSSNVLAFAPAVRICMIGGRVQRLKTLIQSYRDDAYEAHAEMRRTNL